MANAKYAIVCAFLWDSLLRYLSRQTTKYLFQSTANDSLNPPCRLHIFHKVVFLQYWFIYIWGKVFSIDAGVTVCHNSCCKASEGGTLVTGTRSNTLACADLPPWAAQFLHPPCCHFQLHAKSYGANSAGVCSAWGIHSIWRVVRTQQDPRPKVCRVLRDQLPIL